MEVSSNLFIPSSAGIKSFLQQGLRPLGRCAPTPTHSRHHHRPKIIHASVQTSGGFSYMNGGNQTCFLPVHRAVLLSSNSRASKVCECGSPSPGDPSTSPTSATLFSPFSMRYIPHWDVVPAYLQRKHIPPFFPPFSFGARPQPPYAPHSTNLLRNPPAWLPYFPRHTYLGMCALTLGNGPTSPVSGQMLFFSES